MPSAWRSGAGDHPEWHPGPHRVGPDLRLARRPHAELRATWRTLLKDFALAPFIAAVIGILTFFMMLPASLLTAPFTGFAARRLRSGVVTALAVGAAIGTAEVTAFLVWDGGFRGPWSRPGLPGDPRRIS